MAPPWLLKLGSTSGPLVDDAEVHRNLARLKLDAEREDRAQSGALFRGPMVPADRPEPRPLPFDVPAQGPVSVPEPGPEAPPIAPPTSPVPPADLATFRPPEPVGMGGMPFPQPIAPPSAPPPPLPADRPPDTFRFPPMNAEQHAE